MCSSNMEDEKENGKDSQKTKDTLVIDLDKYEKGKSPVRVSTRKFGTLRLRVSLSIGDFIYLSELLYQEIDSREFTWRTIHHLLVSPNLLEETVSEFPDKLLIRIGTKWANHKLINKKFTADSPPFQGFRTLVLEYVQEENRKFIEIVTDFLDSMDKNRQSLEQESDLVAPLLKQANLWLPPSTSENLIRVTHRLADRSDSTAAIKDAITYFYEKDNWSNLREIVASWKNNPLFLNRISIIEDAMEAHINGKYTLSIPALLPQIEGIAISLLKESGGRPQKSLVGVLERWPHRLFESASKKNVLSFVLGTSGYGQIQPSYFTPEKYPEWLEAHGLIENQVLNRHAILHGVQINYASKENSLRAFLLLDVLAFLSDNQEHKDSS